MMTFDPADFCIEARWIAPMTVRNQVLEEHSLLIRDGRILDILPSAIARERYAGTAVVRRSAHLLMPGLMNTHSDASRLLYRGARGGAPPAELLGPQFTRDGILAAIAEMLKCGVTCFSDSGLFPEETALAASEQGMRVVIGMPVAETSQSLTRSLDLRDQYLSHPLISTAFAPQRPNALSDQTFARIATLANELDAGILMEVQQSSGEIDECLEKFGLRPLERLGRLGLLTPALNAVHLAAATAADIDLASSSGMSITLCPRANLRSGAGLPPLGAFANAGIRMGLGSAGATSMSQEIWPDMQLIALMSSSCGVDGAELEAWDVLCMATRGGASALGLEGDVGTLQFGKWADLCCVDLSSPATQPLGDPLAQLALNGGRDLVSDVWVAGRHLLSESVLTRLDWSGTAARNQAWSVRLNSGG